MTTATVLLSVAVVVLAALLGVVGWAVRRQVTRNDGISKTLGEHTAAIAQISASLSAMALGQSRVLDENEELDDAVQQLQLATSILRERWDAHDIYHRNARANGGH